jgi:hypothetical protein
LTWLGFLATFDFNAARAGFSDILLGFSRTRLDLDLRTAAVFGIFFAAFVDFLGT